MFDGSYPPVRKAEPQGSSGRHLPVRFELHAKKLKLLVATLSHLAKYLRVMPADANTLARCKAQAKVLKALAHPSRLLMVEELSRHERCVCELAELVGAEMPTVSRHLAQLKHAGIVEDDKRGAQVFYRLRTPCVMNFFACICDVSRQAATRDLELAA